MKAKFIMVLFISCLAINPLFSGNKKVAKEDQTEDKNKSRKDKGEQRSKKIKELKVLAQNAIKEKKSKDAVTYYSRAAKLGDSGSQCFLGSCYLYGMHGIEKDIDKAVYWYRRAAKQGNKIAQDQLVRCFATGKVTTKGRKTGAQRSAKWSEKSNKPE